MPPGRPDGSTGWIAERGTRQRETSWHLVVNLARRRVTAYRDGRVARALQAVVGKPSTPTPTSIDWLVARIEPGTPVTIYRG
jgi:hypothetical protein